MRRDSLRLEGFDYVGRHIFFLTYCTFQRASVFTHAESVSLVHSQILRAAAQQSIAISAYCYMPDHVHLLAAGRSDHSNGKVFIAKSKQLSGYEFRKRTGLQLWQRYAYDRLVRPDTQSTVVRYILGNPVEAGLVDAPLDYPFSGSEVWDRSTLTFMMKGYLNPRDLATRPGNTSDV